MTFMQTLLSFIGIRSSPHPHRSENRVTEYREAVERVQSASERVEQSLKTQGEPLKEFIRDVRRPTTRKKSSSKKAARS